jgi:hypothetical protein
MQSPFDLEVTFKRLSEPLELNIHDLLNLNRRFVPDDDDTSSLKSTPEKSLVKPAVFTRSNTSPRIFLNNVRADTVRHILANTTQPHPTR